MTQSFLNSLMATWKTLVHPHRKCMHQQVAVFKKHATFCRVSRVSDATFLLLGAFDDLAQTCIDRKPAKSRGMGRKCKKKGMTSPYKSGKSPNLGTPGVLLEKTDLTLGTSSTDVQEASDRNWHNSWWTTSRSTASSCSVHAVSPSWASCIRMSQQKKVDCISTKYKCTWCLWSGLSCVRCRVLRYCQPGNGRRSRRRPRPDWHRRRCCFLNQEFGRVCHS